MMNLEMFDSQSIFAGLWTLSGIRLSCPRTTDSSIVAGGSFRNRGAYHLRRISSANREGFHQIPSYGGPQGWNPHVSYDCRDRRYYILKDVTKTCKKMSDRKRGVLTSGQREFLESGAEFTDYKKRSDIRKHIHSSIVDFQLLFTSLPEKDREKIFDPRQAPNVDYDSPLESGGTDRGMAGNKADIEIESFRLETAISDLIAFLYEGLAKYRTPHSRDFDAILQNAIHRVEKRNNWTLERYNFEVDFDKSDQRLDEIHSRFENRQATMNEATLLLQQGVISDEEFTEYAQDYNR